MKILMFLTHWMKYIRYSPTKSKYPLFTIEYKILKKSTSTVETQLFDQ